MKITLYIHNEIFIENLIALVDSGADLNCVHEGLIPTKYFEKTTERFNAVNGSRLSVQYKISNVIISNESLQIKTPFILVKDMGTQIILGALFAQLLFPYYTNFDGISKQHLGKTILLPYS